MNDGTLTPTEGFTNPAAEGTTAAASVAGAPTGTPATASPTGEGISSAEGKPNGAPESYTDFAIPEGVVVDGSVLDQFKGLAKGAGLSQDSAQKLVSEMTPKIAQQQQEQLQQALLQAQETWTGESRADKEFGGASFEANLAMAKTALGTYGSPELKNLLVESGLGNHPEVIRFFYRVGAKMQEDSVATGTAPAQQRSPAEVLYGSTKH